MIRVLLRGSRTPQHPYWTPGYVCGHREIVCISLEIVCGYLEMTSGYLEMTCGYLEIVYRDLDMP
jgi:hypothetical protein